MWVITKHRSVYSDADRVGTRSADYRQGTSLPYKFLLVDDDGHVYYQGRSDRNDSFAPLDDFGRADVGATEILYFSRDTGQWEAL